jgi:hypothetical protein
MNMPTKSKKEQKFPVFCQFCGHNMSRSRVKITVPMTVRCNKCKTVFELHLTPIKQPMTREHTYTPETIVKILHSIKTLSMESGELETTFFNEGTAPDEISCIRAFHPGSFTRELLELIEDHLCPDDCNPYTKYKDDHYELQCFPGNHGIWLFVWRDGKVIMEQAGFKTNEEARAWGEK